MRSKQQESGVHGVAWRPGWAVIAAAVAGTFGALTVASAGAVLLGGANAAGNAVPFVLWFNFLSGFVYLLAGAGLFLWKRWAAQLSALLAIAILVVFAAFGWHVASGGAYEMRTVGAMMVRSGVWICIAIATCCAFDCFKTGMSASGVPGNGRMR